MRCKRCPQLAHEYALRDALKQVEKERARLTAEHAAAMADARAKWEAELEARLSAMREAMRKQVCAGGAGWLSRVGLMERPTRIAILFGVLVL